MARTEVLGVRLTKAEMAQLDSVRGVAGRGEWARRLVLAALRAQGASEDPTEWAEEQ